MKGWKRIYLLHVCSRCPIDTALPVSSRHSSAASLMASQLDCTSDPSSSQTSYTQSSYNLSRSTLPVLQFWKWFDLITPQSFSANWRRFGLFSHGWAGTLGPGLHLPPPACQNCAKSLADVRATFPPSTVQSFAAFPSKLPQRPQTYLKTWLICYDWHISSGIMNMCRDWHI